MKLEPTLYRNSYVFFIVFFLLMLAGFWLTYFTRILDQENYRMHTHGAVLILWCIMLISQPYLIRANKYTLHRQVGKLSYVLVPLMVYTTLDLLKYRLSENPGTMDFFFIALVVNALVVFVILYVLAMVNRKKPAVHARYMVCTAFPMITPITDRITHIHFPSVLPYLYTIEGNPIAPVVGFVMADLLLIGLSIWDWVSHKRVNVFPVALALLILYHYSVLSFYKYDFWREFCLWFSNL